MHVSVTVSAVSYLFEIHTFSFYSSQRYTRNCRARLIKPVGDVIEEQVEIRGKHFHAPDAREIEKKRVLTTIKNAAKNSRDNARRIIAESVGNVSVAAAASLPSVKSMTRMIGRIRQQNKYPKNPKSLQELILPEEFTKTEKGDLFLLHDSGPNNNRLMIFGTAENLSLLAECNSIYMDGTFDVTPPLFKQLYTIHGDYFFLIISIFQIISYF